MRPRRRSALAGLLAATTVIAAAPLGANAAPPAGPVPSNPQIGDQVADEYAFVDNRGAAVAPRSQARALSARAGSSVTRWNTLGTPASVSLADGPLATGLKGDPETVVRSYLKKNLALYSLSAEAVDELELVTTTKIGQGAVVLLRQKYGSLPAAHDGLVSVAVKGGDVLRVTSSLSPRTDDPAPAQLPAGQALTGALADAGLDADDVAQQRVRLVAVPMPGAAPRAAYEVVLTSDDAEHPLGYTTYVDAVDGKVLLRENLVNFAEDNLAEDNPRWKVFPATPTAAGTDSRQTWCTVAATGCARQVADPATGQPWDVDATTGAPTFTTAGNSAEAVRLWGDGSPATPAREQARPRVRVPVHQPVEHLEVRPGVARLAATGRCGRCHRESVRHAQPDARLVLRTRVHRGHLEPAESQHVAVRPRR